MSAQLARKPRKWSRGAKVGRALRKYWANMTPEERSEENQRRFHRKKKNGAYFTPKKHRFCEYGSCKNPFQAKGLCAKHYTDWRRGKITTIKDYENHSYVLLDLDTQQVTNLTNAAVKTLMSIQEVMR